MLSPARGVQNVPSMYAFRGVRGKTSTITMSDQRVRTTGAHLRAAMLRGAFALLVCASAGCEDRERPPAPKVRQGVPWQVKEGAGAARAAAAVPARGEVFGRGGADVPRRGATVVSLE